MTVLDGRQSAGRRIDEAFRNGNLTQDEFATLNGITYAGGVETGEGDKRGLRQIIKERMENLGNRLRGNREGF